MAPNPSTMSYDQLLQTSQDFIAALSSLDVDKMLALRAPDCQHIILPTSLGRKGMSNEEFRTTYTTYLSRARFQDYNITTHSTAIDVHSPKVVVHASGQAITVAGPFKSEYIFLITVGRGGGGMIERVEEFVDSKLSAEEGGKVREALAKGKEEAEEGEGTRET